MSTIKASSNTAEQGTNQPMNMSENASQEIATTKIDDDSFKPAPEFVARKLRALLEAQAERCNEADAALKRTIEEATDVLDGGAFEIDSHLKLSKKAESLLRQLTEKFGTDLPES